MVATSVPTSALGDNIAALVDTHPALARVLDETCLPDTFRRAKSRDGAETFLWTTPDGRENWLGRTSMPTVSAPALVESFDPGMGNVLLYTFGQGEEVALLLGRLCPHQAIFVVEPSATMVHAALELRDFGGAIRSQRLCVFTGDDGWSALQKFLVDRPGFLVPQRILVRPWFDPALIHELRQRLTDVADQVAEGRRGATGRTGGPSTDDSSVAIVSNLASPEVHRWAADLADAAQRLGWAPRRFVLDDPTMVEPAFTEKAILAANCKAILVIGVSPESLPYRLPPVAMAVLTMPDDPMPEWTSTLPKACTVATSTPIASPAIEAKTEYFPAAVPDRCVEMKELEGGDAVAVVADFIDTSSQSVGLSLASHLHLWSVADELLASQGGRFQEVEANDAAEELLKQAEKKLGFELRAPEVRDGLTQRIERILLPAHFREGLVQAIARTGRKVILLGHGWRTDGLPQNVLARRWSPFDPAQWTGVGFVIVLQDHYASREKALMAAALGLPVAIRGPASSDRDDPMRLIHRFRSMDEGLGLLQDSFAHRESALTEARRLRDLILQRHTWSSRLRGLLAAMGSFRERENA